MTIKGNTMLARSGGTATAEPIEGAWDLPSGWHWRRLSEVTDSPKRGEPRTRFAKTFSYLDVSGIEQGSLSPRCVPVESAPSRARQFLEPNDTVISGVRIYLRNFGLIEVGGPDVASTAFCVLRPRSEIEPHFLFYWIGSDPFIQRLLPLQRGNSPPAVLDDDVRHQVIPVPPLAVQKKIVRRIDDLFSGIGGGERALAEARAGLDTYRKALFRAAFSGELTKQWRAESPQQLNGADYLKKILDDRRLAWATQPRTSQRRYREPDGPDMAALPQLPPSWVWASLQQIAFISGGLTVDQKRKPSDPIEVPYLRVANVQRGYLDLKNVKTIPVAREELASLELRPGDILLNEGGDRDKIGRGWIWEEQLPLCAHQNHVFKARPASDVIRPALVSLYLNEMGRKFFLDKGTQTTNLASISLSKISRAPVPVPPPDEADAILKAIFGILKVEERQAELVQAVPNTFRQAILSAAFRGDLVQ